MKNFFLACAMENILINFKFLPELPFFKEILCIDAICH